MSGDVEYELKVCMVQLPGGGFAVTPRITSLLRLCVALKRAGGSTFRVVCAPDDG